jgi:hypothetical protein
MSFLRADTMMISLRLDLCSQCRQGEILHTCQSTHRHATCVSCRAEAEYSNAATQQEAERAEKAIKAAVAALKVGSRTKRGA